MFFAYEDTVFSKKHKFEKNQFKQYKKRHYCPKHLKIQT